MPIAQVPAAYVARLLEKAEHAGCNIDELLASLELTRARIESHGEVSAFTYGKIYQRIMLALNDEWFGMFAGGKVPLGAFRLMCLTLLQAKDFRQAVIRMGEFAEVCRGMEVRFLVEENRDRVSLTLAPVRSSNWEAFRALQGASDPNNILTSLFTSYRFHCWLVAKTVPLLELDLSFSRGATVFDLNDVNAAKVNDEAGYNRLVYPRDILDAPIVQDLNSTLEFVRTAPYHLVTLDANRQALRDKVRALLNRDVGNHMLSSETVAQRLNMSVATLRRKLLQEGTSYQALKDEVRLEAALHYLSCLDLSNAEVAEKLGFDEPSAFFRAFKKWTGQTPGQYRQGLTRPSPALVV